MSVRALAELMAQAQGYAEFSMRKIGHVPPTLTHTTGLGIGQNHLPVARVCKTKVVTEPGIV